ncbi:hypothetical protein Shyd_59980 [Streptomyces hydrogenans]|uniref:OmpR/PhoB-type domain-containing protein n=1 Tax=Streptomyces hydrogenans TaxID=1873719 RepID=A0ABQ3PHX0_9ACTN|nr:hypothetical protein Shyd_59980 [Streptomyces hydrogenans]
MAGLEGGADDWMTKHLAASRSCSPGCRLRLAHRRPRPRGDRAATAATSAWTCAPGGPASGDRTVDLTALSSCILGCFLRHPGRCSSREQILSHVWGYDFDPGSNIVDVYIPGAAEESWARSGWRQGAGHGVPAAVTDPSGGT